MADLLSVEKTATELGVSKKTVRRMIEDKRLSAVRVRRRVLVPTASIDALKEGATRERHLVLSHCLEALWRPGGPVDEVEWLLVREAFVLVFGARADDALARARANIASLNEGPR